jgi:hypothetical protein
MTMPAERGDTVSRNDQSAHDALRQAHESGYRFPEGFNGFTAQVTVIGTENGAIQRAAGTVSVASPHAIEVDISGVPDLANWARQELGSMTGHRWPTPYEMADGRWTLTIEDETGSPLGRLVTVHGDPFQSAYRLRNGRISQVIRTMGATRFTITIQNHGVVEDGRVLPMEFTVNYWDTGHGRLTRSDAYTDRYAQVNDVWVPRSRRVVTATDAGLIARELELSAVTLLREPHAEPVAEMERHATRAG